MDDVIAPLPDPAQAQGALRDAAAARSALAVRGGWPRGYLLAFAAGSLVVVPLIGLAGAAGLVVAMCLWVVLISVMVSWAQRQRVHPRDGRSRQGWAWATWALLYGAAIFLGEFFFPGRPAFWIPAAVVVAASMAVWAVLPATSLPGRVRR